MLGKTRQEQGENWEERYDVSVGRARGVLRRSSPSGRYKLFRMSPPPEAAFWVENCWMVRWEIEEGVREQQETLPHPNFHLVFEGGAATVSGVHTGKFTRMLEGSSFAFGVRFRAGAFRPFLRDAAASLGNKTVPAAEIFGGEVDGLLGATSNEEEMTRIACSYLLARKPAADPAVAEAGKIVESILRTPDLRTVDELAAHTGTGKRALQRLFHEYVGASPKWVIRRYRLHELVERCHAGEKLEYAQVALELGYFDQAHLINDFRSIVGFSPAQYQQIAGGSTPKTKRPS
jgi:AraC-like DNA-binding protein